MQRNSRVFKRCVCACAQSNGGSLSIINWF